MSRRGQGVSGGGVDGVRMKEVGVVASKGDDFRMLVEETRL